MENTLYLCTCKIELYIDALKEQLRISITIRRLASKIIYGYCTFFAGY